MPDLGNRAHAIGPQPIEPRLVPPAAMFAAAHLVLDLFAVAGRDAGKGAELEALAMPKVLGELRALVEAIGSRPYDRHEIVVHAKVNAHYYIKGRLFGRGVEPFTLQMRLGEHHGRWMVWEVANLSGGRTAWTR
ncbi:MAG TPA: hypothetical protein VFB33_04890 [Candidatus Binataceae bacterium]|nr:hypothetical protein [Candidatus Binataceae bacterium]